MGNMQSNLTTVPSNLTTMPFDLTKTVLLGLEESEDFYAFMTTCKGFHSTCADILPEYNKQLIKGSAVQWYGHLIVPLVRRGTGDPHSEEPIMHKPSVRNPYIGEYWIEEGLPAFRNGLPNGVTASKYNVGFNWFDQGITVICSIGKYTAYEDHAEIECAVDATTIRLCKETLESLPVSFCN